MCLFYFAIGGISVDSRSLSLQKHLGTTVSVQIDRPAGTVHKGIVYPVNYGFIPGLPGGDGEEQDAYILGVTQPLQTFTGQVIGAIRRYNDCEDKLIVAPAGTILHQGQLAEATAFQEQYFDTHVISLFYKSCGVLPYREINGEREYLIVYEHFSQCWSLPKGHMEDGETESQTALRELFEETGLTAELDVKISASIEYPVFSASKKQVLFFLGRVTGEPKTREGEIDSFKWVGEEKLSNYLFPDTVAACKEMILQL